jgi:hypothetical protein
LSYRREPVLANDSADGTDWRVHFDARAATP